jgi:hypothetical protein
VVVLLMKITDDKFYDAKDEEGDINAEEMELIMNAGGGIPVVDGKPKPLLPPLAERIAVESAW